MTKINSLNQNILDVCTMFQSDQVIHCPTRITPNSSTFIDLISLPKAKHCTGKGVISLGISDHSLVYINLKELSVYKKPIISHCSSFRKFCADEFVREGKRLSWEYIYENTDVESVWQYFQRTFLQLCDKYAPYISVRKKSVGAPWVTEEIHLVKPRIKTFGRNIKQCEIK